MKPPEAAFSSGQFTAFIVALIRVGEIDFGTQVPRV
jgi:hypothetical protein